MTRLKRSQSSEEKLRRTASLTVMLNPREARALDVYCKRFRVRSKSDFVRRTIMQAIIGRFESEHPTLWEQNEPSLFNQETKNV